MAPRRLLKCYNRGTMPRANFQTLLREQLARKLRGEATLHRVSAGLSVSHSATMISADVDSTSVHKQGSQNIHNGSRFNRILAQKGGSLVKKKKAKRSNDIGKISEMSF